MAVAQEIEITDPKGRVVVFPAGTDPAVIARVMREGYVKEDPQAVLDRYRAANPQDVNASVVSQDEEGYPGSDSRLDERANVYVANNAQESAARAEAQRQISEDGANSGLAGGVRALSSGMSYGFSDELEAALVGAEQRGYNLQQRLMGDPIPFTSKQLESAYLAEVNNAQRDFRESNGALDLGLNIAGGVFAPGAMTAGNYVARGAANAPRFMTGTGLGAQTARAVPTSTAVGAAYGAGNAEGGSAERGQGAVEGGLIGGITGAAAPAFGQGAGFVGDRAIARPISATVRSVNRATGGNLLNADREAAKRLALAMRDDGFTPEQINAAVDEWQAVGGPSPSLLDIVSQNGGGQQTRALIRGSAMSGPARTTASTYNDRIEANIQGDAIGRTRQMTPETRTAGEVTDALTEGRAAQAEVDYAGPYRAQVQVDDNITSAVSDDAGRAALRRARAAAEARRNYEQVAEIDALLAGEGQTASAGTIDRTRIAMAGRGRNLMTGSSARPDVAGGLFDRANDLDRALDAVPAIQPARETYRRFSDGIEGMEIGAGIRSADPDDLAAQLAGREGAQYTAPTGAARSLSTSIGKPAEGSTGLLNVIGSSDNMRRNLATIFGEENAAQYQQSINQIIERVRNSRFINPNTGSQTAGRAVDETLVESGIPTSGLGVLTRIIAKIGRGATLTDQERDAIVRLATGTARNAPAPRAARGNVVPRMTPAIGGQIAAENTRPRVRMVE